MTSLGYEIGVLIGEFDSNVKYGRDMPVGEQRLMMSRLMTLGRLAGNIETELQVLRLAEDGRDGRAVVEQLAGDELNQLAHEPKVVRPDFGRKS